MRIVYAAAIVLFLAAFGSDLAGQWQTGLRPTESAYGAMVYMLLALQGQYVFALAIMAAFVLAKSFAGRIDGVRRQTFDNVALIWGYAAAQGLVAVAVSHLFPRMIG